MKLKYLESGKINVLVQIFRIALQVVQAEFHLLFLGLETGWDQTVQTKSLTLGQSERHALKIRGLSILFRVLRQ